MAKFKFYHTSWVYDEFVKSPDRLGYVHIWIRVRNIIGITTYKVFERQSKWNRSNYIAPKTTY